MSTPLPRYRAYLLRLWDANSRGPPAWHASLEDTHTGERWRFADLEHLAAFLAMQIDGGSVEEDATRPGAEEDRRPIGHRWTAGACPPEGLNSPYRRTLSCRFDASHGPCSSASSPWSRPWSRPPSPPTTASRIPMSWSTWGRWVARRAARATFLSPRSPTTGSLGAPWIRPRSTPTRPMTTPPSTAIPTCSTRSAGSGAC